MYKCYETERNTGICIFLNSMSYRRSASLISLLYIKATLSSLPKGRNKLHNGFVKYIFLFYYVGLSFN